jgi:hypothetical protein
MNEHANFFKTLNLRSRNHIKTSIDAHIQKTKQVVILNWNQTSLAKVNEVGIYLSSKI